MPDHIEDNQFNNLPEKPTKPKVVLDGASILIDWTRTSFGGIDSNIKNYFVHIINDPNLISFTEITCDNYNMKTEKRCELKTKDIMVEPFSFYYG